MNNKELIDFDKTHLWHPYTSMTEPIPALEIVKAQGCILTTGDGRELVDGMSSWWCAIHGYNVSEINRAAVSQLNKFSHVMFGGLTHEPAVQLGKELLNILPEGLNRIFYADSGSVAVEVAMKMAIQYWHARDNSEKNKFLALKKGYHGDTFHAMSVCDPVNGMHSLYSGILPEYLFAEEPSVSFYDEWRETGVSEIKRIIEDNHKSISAVMVEPIVQGAGGMRFYHPEYLVQLRDLCDRYDILLIFDEIATGFGRTGKLFASEHAGVVPDIMTIGKSLTGGYMTMAATITREYIGETISSKGLPFMHGPTFMANPLACSVALASIKLLLQSPWKENVKRIEDQMKKELEKCRNLKGVRDVRVLGAIGVVEMKEPVKMVDIQSKFVEEGVWIRPFGKLIYIMPPFVISENELSKLTTAILKVVGEVA